MDDYLEIDAEFVAGVAKKWRVERYPDGRPGDQGGRERLRGQAVDPPAQSERIHDERH